VSASPRFTEYGKMVEMKKDLKTINEVGASAKPSPLTLFKENAEMIHDVMVSGTFFDTLILSHLERKEILKESRQIIIFDKLL
jgi:hypothetical protein